MLGRTGVPEFASERLVVEDAIVYGAAVDVEHVDVDAAGAPVEHREAYSVPGNLKDAPDEEDKSDEAEEDEARATGSQAAKAARRATAGPQGKDEHRATAGPEGKAALGATAVPAGKAAR